MATAPATARRSRKERGFTLVEVTLAIGIISFSLLALIGLVPSGLGSLRDSMDQTTRAQIVQRISNDLVVADFASIAAATRYFDEQGQETPSAQGACYVAEMHDDAPTLPGLTASDAADLHNRLKCIRVGIRRSENAAAPYHWYSLQVAGRQ